MKSTWTCAALAAFISLEKIAAEQLSPEAQSLFDMSMSVQDPRWDETYKVLWYNDNGPFSNRFTAWYIPGLLHRNTSDDSVRAVDAIEHLLLSQLTENFTSEWYGTYKLSPDEPNPTPNSPLYPPSIYGTYDPNWAEFIGIQLVQIIAEFEAQLPKTLVKKMEYSLEQAAIGSMRRNGTAPDNLILAYSNPGLMRALTVGWIGHRLNNTTFINFANDQGTKLYELFTKNGSNVLGEYNVPNYYGIDVFALASNLKYGPPNATMTKNARYMLKELWKDIGEHYNPYLGNMAGPYDRAYTRDMTSHNAIIELFWWGIFGFEKAPHPPVSDIDFQYDIAQGAAIALVIKEVANIMDGEIVEKLTGAFDGERTIRKTIYPELNSSSIYRVATSWLSKDLMIGGMEQNETVNRGQQFTPATVHWAADPKHKPYPYIGFFTLYPTASTLKAVAEPNRLTISYPDTTQDGTDSFQFMLSGIPPPWNLKGNVVNGFEDIPCLTANVSAPGLELLPTTYYGNMIYSDYYYNITYVVPKAFNASRTPTITFDLEYTC